MANENEDINQQDRKEKSFLEQLDTDFPLSGGEEPATKLDNNEDEELTNNDEKDKKSSFSHDLETEFPLSGGEVD